MNPNAAYRGSMHRGSWTVPLLLIVAGVLLLVNNLDPTFRFRDYLARYWPWALIIWGVVRVAELFSMAAKNLPLPQRGFTGGEWTVASIIFFVGIGSLQATRFSRNISFDFGDHGIPFHFLYREPMLRDVPAQTIAVAAKSPLVVVQYQRGDVRLMGSDAAELKASGRVAWRNVREERANELAREFKVSLQCDETANRCNVNLPNSREELESLTLEITVPRGASVEVRNDRGDLEVIGLNGSVEMVSFDGDFKGDDINGNVKLRNKDMDEVVVRQLKGNLDIEGPGGDLELEDIAGTVSIAGGNTGDLVFRRIGKELRYTSDVSNLTFASIPGELRMEGGDLDAENLVGPVVIRSRSKDVNIDGFQGSLDIDVQRGEVQLNAKNGGGPAKIRTRNGDVTISTPSPFPFQMQALTRRGNVDDMLEDKSLVLQTVENKASRVSGGKAGGPLLDIETDRGNIRLQRGE
jgi:hypothetical protein